MNPAITSTRKLGATRLMVVGQGGYVEHARFEQLRDFLECGDLIVVNRSGTLPSSFFGTIERSGETVELRLAAFQGPNRMPPESMALDLSGWLAVAFGSGTWELPTEKRGVPPVLKTGDRIRFGDDLGASVEEVDALTHRLLRIRFESKRLEQSLYRHGRPIQYSYLKEQLHVWDQQTLFSGPPISVEPPSAAFALTWDHALALQDSGIGVVSILHGAGISATGEDALDRRLPLAEYFYIPFGSRSRINEALDAGRRVIALGTTVVRALESAAEHGTIKRRYGLTTLRVQSGQRLQVVKGLISGMHEPGTSHFELQTAFRKASLLKRGYEEAATRHYLTHEFGDLSFLV